MKALDCRRFSSFGLASGVIFWIVTILSIVANPWFSLTKNAFSDLGASSANVPWVYNYGLVVAGGVALLYSVALMDWSTNKVEVAGSAFMFIAGIFLALIGIYPSGTRAHAFVSTWFFLQMDLAMVSWGIGLIIAKKRLLGILSVAASILAPVGGGIVMWPSIAVLEAYGILLIMGWMVLISEFVTKKQLGIHL
jgi:hypothetical membrane protein